MIRSLLAGALAAAFSTPVIAHVTLESQEAKVGGSYKAVLRVPHGCTGSATTSIRVRDPRGSHWRKADAQARLDTHHRNRQVP